MTTHKDDILQRARCNFSKIRFLKVATEFRTILSISLAFTIPNLENASPEVELGAQQQQLR